ncbi:uncharacterized protein [Miscanthus floridulus]|uniref:uncharacterized protein n=1 Tax=Miscanthus floridulus TaxID=154761 RepID=UPI00345A39D3
MEHQAIAASLSASACCCSCSLPFHWCCSSILKACGRGEEWIFVRFRDHHYFRGDDILHISFEELHQLYHMDALDKSIISSFCLLQMSELQRIQDTSVGFIDPYIVFKTDIIAKEQWVSEAQKNIMMFFMKQHDKTTILFSYNFEFHWILIVIDLNSSRLVILNSLRKERALYQDMIDIIQGVWKEFIRQHRKDCKAPLNVVEIPWCLR